MFRRKWSTHVGHLAHEKQENEQKQIKKFYFPKVVIMLRIYQLYTYTRMPNAKCKGADSKYYTYF